MLDFLDFCQLLIHHRRHAMNVSVDRISFQTAARDNYCPGVCFQDFSAHSFPGCVKSPKVIHRHFDEQQSSRNSLFPLFSVILCIIGSKRNHLLFLNDFGVPIDNNMSERDLRKAKNRQKMAGGFCKASGNEMYCSILSIIETLKRRELAILENIKCLFMGTPAIF